MKKIILVLIGLLVLGGFFLLAKNTEATKGDDDKCKIYLTHKNEDWVEFGKKGQLHYDYSSIHFIANDLTPNTGYTLIEYPEPAPNPWPAGGWGVVEIVSGTSNSGGHIDLTADYSVSAGKKYWLVLTSDLSGGKMVNWHPAEYLFEHELLPDNECLNRPTPSPTASPEPSVSPTPSPEPSESSEPTATPSATPTVTPEAVDPGQPLTQAGAPICPDGNIVALPIAFQVVRQGDHATLTWFKTAGDKVNIYFKEVDQANWTHAVGDVPNVDPKNEYVIGGLVPSVGYTFAIEQHQGCGGGQLVQSIIIDGASYKPVVFTDSYWAWSN